MAGFIGLVTALAFLIGHAEAKATTLAEAVAGHGLVLLGLTALFLVLAPGATFLFQVPLAGMMLAQGFVHKGADDELNPRHCPLLAAVLAPAVLLMVPMARDLYLGLLVRKAWVVASLCGLLIGLLLPLSRALVPVRNGPNSTEQSRRTGRAFLGGAVAGLAAFGALFLMAAATPPFSTDYPRLNCLGYVFDSDTRQALWVSDSLAADAWTSKFLGSAPESQPLPGYFPIGRGAYLVAPTEARDLAAPEVTLTRDSVDRGVRSIEVRVASARGAPLVQIILGGKASFRRVLVGQTVLEGTALHGAGGDSDVVLNYWAPPSKGIVVMCDLPVGAALALRVNEVTFTLPTVGPALPPRPPDMMAAPFGSRLTDCTVVSRLVFY
jgi:hypothetical protein